MTDEHKAFISTDSKINDALGITNGETVDDVLAEFDSELNEIESGMQDAVQKIDGALVNGASGDIHDLTSSLGELSDLISTSKGMLKDVYEYVSSSEIMDPDVISAGADLIKTSNELIREYLDIYKEKMRHFHSIELEMIKNQNKKDLELYKYELKNGKVTDDTDGPVDLVEYTQERVVKVMSDIDQ